MIRGRRGSRAAKTRELLRMDCTVRMDGPPFRVKARIATGSERTVLRASVNVPILGWEHRIWLVLPDGTKIAAYEAPAIITVKGHSAAVAVAVVKDPIPQNLLGQDFIAAVGIESIDCGTGQLTFREKTPRREFHVGAGLYKYKETA